MTEICFKTLQIQNIELGQTMMINYYANQRKAPLKI